jgi:hypothetical protein
MNSIDILDLEWPKSDRDLNIVTPILVYLNKKYNIKYKTVSIFNGYYYVLKYRPKLVVVSNFCGSIVNESIVKLLYLSGIKVVSLISEGNVAEYNPDRYLWRSLIDSERRLYLDKFILWSVRSKNLFLNKYPELESVLAVSGAVGFDRYRILNFKDKHSFLKENGLKYKKIIGIAGFGFDIFFADLFKQEMLKSYDYEQIKMFREDLYKIQNIYRMLIENNKDILFILRHHPGTFDFEKNEFYGLDTYKNVFVSSNFINSNLEISDLINISDLWIGYETTTALESWLLGKKTFLINPTRTDFNREIIYKGSAIAKNYNEAQKFIDEYYANGTIDSFEELEAWRKKIIKDIIEYDDGKNYQRAADEIVEVLNRKDREIKFRKEIYYGAAKQILKLFLSKTIFKNRWQELKYKSNFAEKYQKIYSKAIDA